MAGHLYGAISQEACCQRGAVSPFFKQRLPGCCFKRCLVTRGRYFTISQQKTAPGIGVGGLLPQWHYLWETWYETWSQYLLNISMLALTLWAYLVSKHDSSFMFICKWIFDLGISSEKIISQLSKAKNEIAQQLNIKVAWICAWLKSISFCFNTSVCGIALSCEWMTAFIISNQYRLVAIYWFSRSAALMIVWGRIGPTAVAVTLTARLSGLYQCQVKLADL